jgi:hypothetical protein
MVPVIRHPAAMLLLSLHNSCPDINRIENDICRAVAILQPCLFYTAAC